MPDQRLMTILERLAEAERAAQERETVPLQQALEAARQTEEARTAAGWHLPGELAEIGQGLSFGLLDEGSAALRAGAGWAAGELGLMEPRSFGEMYDEGLTAQRIERDQAYDRNPVLTTTNALAGGLAPLALTGGAGLGVNAAAQGASRMTLPTMMATGAGAGALGGFGEAEGGLMNRLEGALVGGGVGMAAAPLIGGLMNAGSAAGRLARGMTGANATRTAGERFTQGLAHDDLDINAVMRFLEAEQINPRGGIAADAAGPNSTTMSLLEAVAQRPGPRMREVSQTLEARVAGAGDRIADDFRTAFGGADRDFFADMASLDASRRARAAPAYEAAFSNNPAVWSDRLGELWSDPIISSAAERGREIVLREALAEGRQIDPRVFDLADGMMPSLQVWDAVKRGLDDILEGYRDGTTGRLNLDQRGRSIEMLRQSLVQELDSAAPDYATARAAWAGPSQMMDAMMMGQDFLNRRPQEIRDILRRMSDSERDAYVTGVYDRLTRTITEMRETANTAGDRRIWGTPAQQDRLRTVINAISPDQTTADATFARLMDAMTREDAMAQVRNQVTRNSATARRTAAQDIALGAGSGAAIDVLTGMSGIPTVAGAATGAARHVADRATHRIQDELGRILMTNDPEELQRLLAPALQGNTLLPYLLQNPGVAGRYSQMAPIGALATALGSPE